MKKTIFYYIIVSANPVYKCKCIYNRKCIQGCGSKGGGGLKFVKVVQFWKIIAHWIALTELYVLGALKSCDFNVHIF